MESPMMSPQYPSPHLKKVLRSYQSAASNSLSGPNGILTIIENAKYGFPKVQDLGANSVAHLKVQDLGANSVAHLKVQDLGASPICYSKVQDIGTSPLGYSEVQDLGANPAAATDGEADTKPRILVDQFQTLKLKRHKQKTIHPPILTAADRSWTEHSETILEGHSIACFVVGGEKRLCLAQVMNCVLIQFHIADINTACDDLHIYCSLCSPEQLEILKAASIIPRNAASCGLITKTDAERLCSALLRRPVPLPYCTNHTKQQQQQSGWFRVYHECFGKCEGICKPELYTTPISPCIECADCGMLLSPQYFVSHAHRSLQNRTCHWGFDSAAWRDYLLLARRQHQYEGLLRHLESFKQKFAADENPHQSNGKIKRKPQVDEVFKQDCEAVIIKKCKEEDDEGSLRQTTFPFPHSLATPPFPYESVYVYGYPYPDWPIRPHAPPPRAGRDSPPLLQQNYRFEADRLDKSYQPNVALAPPNTKPLPPVTSAPLVTSYSKLMSPRRNPEIELSSTDTEDSDLVSVDVEEKLGEDLDPDLAKEVQLVEELLRHGRCDPASGKDVVQSFRKLCLRLMWSEQELNRQRQISSSPPTPTKWSGSSLQIQIPVKRESEDS